MNQSATLPHREYGKMGELARASSCYLVAMAMTPCPRCRRHLRAHSLECPFCGTTRLLKAGALLLAGTGFVTLLSACYGPPPRAIEIMNGPDDASSPAPAPKAPRH